MAGPCVGPPPVTWALVLSLSGRSMPRSAFSLHSSSSCAVLTTRGLALSSSLSAGLSLLGPSSSTSCSWRPFLMPPPPSAAYLNGAVTKQGLLQADTKTRAGWVAAGRQVRTSIGHRLPHFLTAALKDSRPLSELQLFSASKWSFSPPSPTPHPRRWLPCAPSRRTGCVVYAGCSTRKSGKYRVAQIP